MGCWGEGRGGYLLGYRSKMNGMLGGRKGRVL